MLGLGVLLGGFRILGILKYIPWQGWLLGALLAAGVFTYYKGEHDGAARIQARWDTAVTNMINTGNVAHDKAEASVPPAPAAAPTKPCVVRDRFDRDCK